MKTWKATYFLNVNSLEELKKRYKELALKHHPDRKGGSTAIMQEIIPMCWQKSSILKESL